MTNNNPNIIRIPLDYSENSSSSLSNYEKSEKKINIGTANDNINKNKNEEKKILEEGNDKAAKGEGSEGKDENSEKDIISKNNIEERQNEIFEIITSNNISQFYYKNSVIKSQGDDNTDNYPTFQNKNINELGSDKSKFIFIYKIYFNYS